VRASRRCCFCRSALGLRCTTWADRHRFFSQHSPVWPEEPHSLSFENMCLLLPVRHRIRKCTADRGRQFDGGTQMSGHHRLGSHVTFRPQPLRTPSPAAGNRLRCDTGLSRRLRGFHLEAATSRRHVANYRAGVVHLPFHRRHGSPFSFVPSRDLCKLHIRQNLIRTQEPRSQSDRQLSSLASREFLTFLPVRRHLCDRRVRVVAGSTFQKHKPFGVIRLHCSDRIWRGPRGTRSGSSNAASET